MSACLYIHDSIYIYICQIKATHKLYARPFIVVKCSVFCESSWFKNYGLMADYKVLVGIGRSGRLFGRSCLSGSS
jgi:hypothetical protein